MGQYQRLFLIADPAMRHSQALQRAAALAEASGAALHITAFVEPFATFALLEKSVREQIREDHLREHREWLADEAGLLRSKGLKVTTEAVWTNQTLKEILLHVSEMQPDLLIKDVQHEPALKRAFVTPLDWHLLRECPAPVHLIGALTHALPRKVVAAVDPSSPESESSGLNQRIIQEATGLALQCNAELHLVYSYDLSSVFLTETDARSGVWPALVEKMQASQKATLEALAERYGVPAERRHFIIGPPTTALADFASQIQADVMVMGTSQRKGLNKLVGSTTEHLLYQVPCSILAIRV
ncbi:universal stress protein [Pseudomonas sp. AOB-7]|uniref:universal stress protein n=1 Tax=Pseudomonas sp. AOB-7 TaxID=2482750 RepID=UPI000EFB870A|nr:universal stress protein [Pseudomonas sp. AOB-7]RMH85902.1 universal stress protein [Pseudomonas sp. AOB-7]